MLLFVLEYFVFEGGRDRDMPIGPLPSASRSENALGPARGRQVGDGLLVRCPRRTTVRRRLQAKLSIPHDWLATHGRPTYRWGRKRMTSKTQGTIQYTALLTVENHLGDDTTLGRERRRSTKEGTPRIHPSRRPVVPGRWSWGQEPAPHRCAPRAEVDDVGTGR